MPWSVNAFSKANFPLGQVTGVRSKNIPVIFEKKDFDATESCLIKYGSQWISPLGI
jgi:hypothetical protein